MHPRVFGLSVLLLAASAAMRPSAAQTGAVGGTVVRDSAGHGLPEAEVTLPGLNRAARTNYLGEFRINGVPAGRHAIAIRRLGFAVFHDSVTVTAGQTLDAEFVMVEQPVSLDSQKVVSIARPVSPFLQEFEARRKMGFGHFMTPDELRRLVNHSFGNAVATRLPGMSLVKMNGAQYLASGRKGCNKPAFQCTGADHCYVSIYIDGVAVYASGVSNDSPPDFNNYKSEDFVAMEYYASGATVPSQYNMTGSDCGVMLLWRRSR